MPNKPSKKPVLQRGANPTVRDSAKLQSGQRTDTRYQQPTASQEASTNWLLLVGAGLLLIFIAMLLVFLLLRTDIKNPSATATPGPASPLGRISFVRVAADSKPSVFVVDPDGARQEQVTHGIVVEGLTAWSPDGRYIVAQISQDGVSTIARISVASDNKGGEVVALTSSMMIDSTDKKADSAFPAWSPDSQKVAFISKKEGGNFQVFVMDKEGHNKRRLSTGQTVATLPSWSPDGKIIAYVGGDKIDVGEPKEIYIVSVDGGAPKKVTSGGKDLSKPTWSPDGKQILYLDNLGDRYSDIMIMNADGTAARKLADGVRSSGPQFNATGDRVLYYYVSNAEPTGSHVYTVPVKGGQPTIVSGNTPDDYEPAWSPDAKMLTWARKEANADGHKIVVAGADGSGVKVVSQGAGDDYEPMWGAAPKP